MRQGFRLNHWCWCVLAKHRCVCFSNCAAPTRNANNLNTRNFSSQIFPTLSPNVWPQFCYRQRQRMDVPYFSSLQQNAVASKILCLIFFCLFCQRQLRHENGLAKALHSWRASENGQSPIQWNISHFSPATVRRTSERLTKLRKGDATRRATLAFFNFTSSIEIEMKIYIYIEKTAFHKRV